MRIRWEGLVIYMWEKRHACGVLVQNCEGRSCLRRSCRWENDIIKMDLKKME
jgi:hypothetical protein